MKDLDQYRQFATVRQLEYLDAIESTGSQRKAAKLLNINARTIEKSIQGLKSRAAMQLAAEHDYANKPIPAGYSIRGVSQYVGQNGAIKGTWIKSGIDDKARELAIQAAVAAMCEDIPALGVIEPPANTYSNLCNVYTLTDSHVGMLAWHKEGGADWDLAIAERTLVGCFAQMVNSSPPAHTGIVAQLGDFLHYDSAISAVTPQSGHVLDADGRMPKMVRVAIRILRTVIDLALVRHEKVIVLLAEGNHDISSSVWLRAMFQALYEANPRVQVIDSELPYYVHQHGRTMIGWHHGHLSKNDQLPILFASQFPKMWGSTSKRYIHCGHRHHTLIKEHSGVTVEQHPTLAARDAYASRGGWIAERQVSSISYSDKFGQVAKNTVTPEMIAD